MTVDPHLHRIHSLDALFTIPARNVAAAPQVAQWLRTQHPDAVLVGPDAESAQWVGAIARQAGLPWQVLDKTRTGDREVAVTAAAPLPPGRVPVLVDDMASTGRTLLAAMAALAAAGAPMPVCVVTTTLFVQHAYTRVMAAYAARIATTDTFPQACYQIMMAPALAADARELATPD